jgi:hypothetical protein
MTSPHFELLTDAGESRGQEALSRLEQIHRAFRSLARGSTGSPVPVRIFLFRSARDFRLFRPTEATTGFYQGGPQRNYIAMQYAGPDTYRVAFHEYVHLVLNHTTARLPRWLEEGTAEFYSTLEASPGRLVVGAPIPQHLQTLRDTAAWLDAETLQSLTAESPHYSERRMARIFYAQSWALVHMLNMSPRYRDGMHKFAVLLEDGIPPAGAFERAFGWPIAKALSDLAGYLRAGIFPVLQLDPGPAEETTISEPQEISGAEAALAQAELLLHMGKTE